MRWPIVTDGESDSKESMLLARLHDDDDDGILSLNHQYHLYDIAENSNKEIVVPGDKITRQIRIYGLVSLFIVQ